MSSKWCVAAVAVAWSVLFINACGGVAQAGNAYKIATATASSDVSHLARAEGVLHGQVNNDGTACFWIGDAPGSRALLWPYGYSARGNPLAVYDETGHQLVAVSQFVVMDGGLLSDDVHSIVGCHDFTQFWGVGRVGLLATTPVDD